MKFYLAKTRQSALRPHQIIFSKKLYTSDSVFNSASIGGKIIFVHLLWDLILACRSILNFISYRSNIPKFKNRRSSWCVLYCKEEYMSPQISLHERPIFNLIYKIWSEIGRKPVNNRFSGKKLKNRGSSWCVNRFLGGVTKDRFWIGRLVFKWSSKKTIQPSKEKTRQCTFHTSNWSARWSLSNEHHFGALVVQWSQKVKNDQKLKCTKNALLTYNKL